MIFLDTDILVELSLGHEGILQALQDLQASGEPLATTSVNVAEFLRGIAAANLPEANRFLGAFAEAPLGPRASRRYGQFMQALDRSGKRMPELDAMVAAVVMEEGGRLMTMNLRHFQGLGGLELVALPS